MQEDVCEELPDAKSVSYAVGHQPKPVLEELLPSPGEEKPRKFLGKKYHAANNAQRFDRTRKIPSDIEAVPVAA
jgi:hypothetical protein